MGAIVTRCRVGESGSVSEKQTGSAAIVLHTKTIAVDSVRLKTDDRPKTVVLIRVVNPVVTVIILLAGTSPNMDVTTSSLRLSVSHMILILQNPKDMVSDLPLTHNLEC
jgi:hypothetical protein